MYEKNHGKNFEDFAKGISDVMEDVFGGKYDIRKYDAQSHKTDAKHDMGRKGTISDRNGTISKNNEVGGRTSGISETVRDIRKSLEVTAPTKDIMVE